jgi:hypothetical protein
MKNLIVILSLITIFAFTSNAQSKESGTKNKNDVTKVEKSQQTDKTMKCCSDAGMKTKTSSKDGKGKCCEGSSCCKMNKDQKMGKTEDDSNKKEMKKETD